MNNLKNRAKRAHEHLILKIIKANNLTNLIIISALLILFSCQKDSTEDIGPSDPRDNFTGTWQCIRTLNKKDPFKFEVTIAKDLANSTRLLMFDFNGIKDTVFGTLADPVVNIHRQKASNFTISGDGNLNKGKIYWNYIINDGAFNTSYEAVFSK